MKLRDGPQPLRTLPLLRLLRGLLQEIPKRTELLLQHDEPTSRLAMLAHDLGDPLLRAVGGRRCLGDSFGLEDRGVELAREVVESGFLGLDLASYLGGVGAGVGLGD